MAETESTPGAPRTLELYTQDSKALGEEDFRNQHGDVFLLHHGPIEQLKAPVDTQSTLAVEGAGTIPERPFSPQADFLVFPINPPSPEGAQSDVAWVGRSEFNEVIIPDATVSEVHAFIKRDEDGAFYIQDTGSRNGTWVNDEPVPAQGMGDAVLLQSGARVRLGTVRLTFLEAAQLKTLISRLFP